MNVKRQKEKKPTAREVAESKKAALIAFALAVVLFIGIMTYVLWCEATGKHAHIHLGVVVADLFLLLLVGSFVKEWRRLKRLRR